MSKGQDNRQLNHPKVFWFNDDIELISLATGIITTSFVIHGSYNLGKVLNFTSRLEKSLNSTEVLEKKLISLLSLEMSSKFTTLPTPDTFFLQNKIILPWKIWLILGVKA